MTRHAARLLPGLALALLSACMDLGEPPAGGAERQERTITPSEDERACDAAPFEAFAPPASLLATEGVGCDPETEGYCFALREELRDVARAADPLDALARAAAAHDDGDHVRARALADLAVSGTRAYAAFAELAPRAGDLAAEASPDGVERALERAYAVAWALRGPASHRASARADLGWIAVSPEDDPPARPTNVPAASFPQHDLTVTVPLDDGRPRELRTRVFVASNAPPQEPFVPRDLTSSVPPAPPPAIEGRGEVILYVPGHSSLAEEGAPLAEALVAQRDAETPITFVAVDLPSNGYAERIDPDEVLDAAAGAQDALLRFHDAFLLAVVEALEAEAPGTRDRIAAVIGGSLGGNLTLRLAEADPPWLSRVVSWSPASIDFSWSRARFVAGDGEFVDVVKHEAVRMTLHESEEAEDDETRHDYFVGGLTSVRKQAGYWYRDDWGCRDAMIRDGLHQLGEIYDDRFRRWHYRVAYEQLVFSHLEPDPDGVRPFERVTVPLLLVTGERDDGVPMQTWSFVERLAPYLTVEGSTLFLRDTGHALHSERPALLAREIEAFLDET